MNRRDFFKASGKTTLALGALNLVAPIEALALTPVWVNTLFHGGDARAMEIIVENINKSQNEVRLDLTQGGWTEYYAQLQSAVMAGVGPNIGICHNFRFDKTHRALYNLEDTPIGNVLKKGNWSRSDFIETAWDQAQVKGVQYGIPLDQNMAGLYYNKDLFKKAGLDPENPPQNKADFENACNALKKIGKLPFHPALSSAPRWIRRNFFILYWGMNGELIEDNRAAFNNQKGIEALQYLVDMVHDRGWNKPGTNANNQFFAGELGMCNNGTWFYLSVEKSAKFDYGCAPMPKFFDKQVTWGTTHNLVLPKQPKGDKYKKKIESTLKALELIVDNNRLWGQFGGHVPMLKKALNDPRLLQSRTWNKTLKHFAHMAFNGIWKTEPRHPKIVEFDAAIQPFIQEAYNGKLSVKDALNKAEKAANTALI